MSHIGKKCFTVLKLVLPLYPLPFHHPYTSTGKCSLVLYYCTFTSGKMNQPKRAYISTNTVLTLHVPTIVTHFRFLSYLTANWFAVDTKYVFT